MANTSRLYKTDKPENIYADPKEKEKAGKKNSQVDAYFREITRYNKAVEDWHKEADEIVDVYMDANRSARSNADSTRKFSLLWSNIQVMRPAIYTKLPQAMVSRRFKDRDPVARTAAELMDRAANVALERYNVDEVFRMVRDDRLLGGRGQAWVRYEAEIEQYEMEGDDDAGGIDADGDDDSDKPDDDGDENSEASAEPADEKPEPEMGERLKSERACVDYVHYRDFGHNIARTWADVWCVWRVVYWNKEKVKGRFGGDVAQRLEYAHKQASGTDAKMDDPDDHAKIYELWDKRRGITCWLAEGHNEFLDSGPPPIKFELGFPCPEPCYATKSNKQLIPRPDYAYYRDQAKEINDLTDKIQRMTQWLVVKGFVPNAPSSIADPIEEVLRDKTNAELFLGIDTMTEWSERGGIAGLIDWFPVEKVVVALNAAIQARNQLIQDVYQITGISDVQRAQTNPNETLGAQELKMQTGTSRLRNTRDEIVRFGRDIVRLVTEVIADKFEPETIADMTGFTYLPPVDPMQALMMGHNGGPPLEPMAPMMGLRPPAPAIGSTMGPSMYQGGQIGAQLPVGQPTGMLPPRMAPPGLPAPPPGMPAPQQNPMAPQQDQMQGSDDSDMVFDDQVMQLLRDDRMRGFRIDIETDSTIQADEQLEKQTRMEFLGAVGPYMQQAVQAIEMAPALAPAIGQMLMFVVRGFRVGAELEQTIEKSFQQLAQQMLQNGPQNGEQGKQPDPSRMADVQRKSEADKTNAQLALMKEQNAERRDQRANAVKRLQVATTAQLAVRKQNLDARTKQVDTAVQAHAQAHDRRAKLLIAAMKPTGRMQ